MKMATSKPSMTFGEWVEERAKSPDFRTKPDMRRFLMLKYDLTKQEGRDTIAAQLARGLELLNEAKSVPDFVQRVKRAGL